MHVFFQSKKQKARKMARKQERKYTRVLRNIDFKICKTLKRQQTTEK